MKTKEERLKIVNDASEEIKNVCEKYCVKFTVADSLISIHQGEWHESGDYSVLEVSLPDEIIL